MEYSLMLYDADCNLCEGLAKFVKNHSNKIQLSSIQSGNGKEILRKCNIAANNLNTILLIENGKILTKSNAVLHIIKKLNSYWVLFYIIVIVPRFLRDKMYNIIANNRYKWFGRKNKCTIY
jgi:predicted DCC family thiol-disulfide oxidoreductase YuxK